ncbi:MAG: hypothetical protein K2L88_05805 [Clostridiales bacterium]|nr:hypothetical protein [Clostridiales bacterium]
MVEVAHRRECGEETARSNSQYRTVVRSQNADDCTEQLDDEFKNRISSFKENVRPSMLSELENCSTHYMIFQTREATAKWLDDFSND